MDNRTLRFSAAALQEAMGGGRAPRCYDRRGRISLIGEAAQALVRGELPGPEAALFLGGALLGWLAAGSGASLERDFLKVIVNGSHDTPSRIWKDLQEKTPPLKGATDPEAADTIAPSTQQRE